MPVSRVRFVEKYCEWLEEIDHVIKPEYYPAIRLMYMQDPRDLMKCGEVFDSEEHAIGFIWRKLIATHKRLNREVSHAAN